MPGRSILAAALVGAVVILTPGEEVRAQTPPTPDELSASDGLHAAAARGDVEEIFRLARSGADLDRRVGGRTPLHVAAFQGQGAAAEALIATEAALPRLNCSPTLGRCLI